MFNKASEVLAAQAELSQVSPAFFVMSWNALL